MSRLRTLALTAASAALGATILAVPAPSDAALVGTPFMMFGNGFGARVTGGSLPAGSSDLGYQTIGCSTKAGQDRTNNTAGATIPGIGTVGATSSRLRTVKSGSTVKTIADHKVASVVLTNSPLGKLTIEGLSSTSQAWWDGSAYKADAKANVAKIVLDPPVGPNVTFPIPGPGKPVTVPGIATIGLGTTTEHVSATQAEAYANGVWVHVFGTDTDVVVGRSRADITKGQPHGVFGGFSDAVDGTALGGKATVGQNPLTNVTCKSTNGKLLKKALGDVELGQAGNVVDVQGLESGQRSSQTSTTASGYSYGSAAHVSLGGGKITIDGLRAQANAKYSTSSGTSSNTSGTSFGAITINGQKASLDQLGSALSKVNIPGLAKIETNVVTNRSSRLVEVVALRLTLLDATDGTKTVLNIGHARFAVNPNA